MCPRRRSGRGLPLLLGQDSHDHSLSRGTLARHLHGGRREMDPCTWTAPPERARSRRASSGAPPSRLAGHSQPSDSAPSRPCRNPSRATLTNTYRNSPPDAQFARRALLETPSPRASNHRSAGVRHWSRGADLEKSKWVDGDENAVSAAHDGNTGSHGRSAPVGVRAVGH
eukprot:scaffold1893_cov120-Isochrysis_galbana.AAC.2